ncbi:C-terminal peptidase (prc) [Fibrobacter sp. UWT3]|uniref:S41 family peptidase n=1 Tax=Fibrobacter sp. UWT3 TaxID=1896225 RepID=UPI000BD97362|nr:S41 family peptidase [Fibrobacter sp. UWT3]SOE47394.1 C-terminal peptidase (prc) [Fibrobacter sp. UWT3]
MRNYTSCITHKKSIHRCIVLACVLPALAFLAACSDFLSPVDSTPAPSEYEYNYWLLQKTYLYGEELAAIPEEGDSVQVLFNALTDRYTRYTEPSHSEAVIESRNTSIITGDIGVEFLRDVSLEHPLFINRVYPESPADRAGVPRYGNVISINGVELTGDDAYSTYRSVFNDTADISLEIEYNGEVKTYDMKRETIYAPTVFVDTVGGHAVINIREFKPDTYDRENGTYGELKKYLESSTGDKSPRILDLRNNPGGHVDQCIRMADLFVRQGTLSSRKWYAFSPDGKRTEYNTKNDATAGDPGEGGKFVLLANNGSASCAEIFAAAVTELEDIPLVGITTYGKGIGQSSWSTPAGGLATITTLEFLTPKGNSYHKKGLVPQYRCEGGASIACAIEAAEVHFGGVPKKTGYAPAKAAGSMSRNVVNEPEIIVPERPRYEIPGGALVENFVVW